MSQKGMREAGCVRMTGERLDESEGQERGWNTVNIAAMESHY